MRRRRRRSIDDALRFEKREECETKTIGRRKV